ncbi:MAG: endonuclease/exonuclease/phosphatase family protein [Bacilli bacterium]|nr:endonuclease/exonuclease/phosphatase family protein [Bacilli bacterium]
MKISTFNIQNDSKTYKRKKVDELHNYIYKNKIDIIGLQEVFPKVDKDIKKDLQYDYKINGKFRFLSKILLRRINEKNPIITNYEVVSSKTYHLPSFPSLTKRILTHVVIKYKDKEISIYNTHLEVYIPSVKTKQLDKIYEIIKNDDRPKVLMGDFNLKTNNDIFTSFIDKMEELGIKRIELNEKTFKTSKYKREIDHIFLSKEFKLKNKEVVKDLIISDHYPVLIDVTFKG